MLVSELIELLQEQNPDSEVRLAIQPNYPFEYDVDCVGAANVLDRRHKLSEIVYIGQGDQIGYLTGDAIACLGW